MDPVDLLEPILQGGIRSVNFFTGRLLSAQDLQQQALAGQQANQQLGRSIGSGVASGLEVSAATAGDPTVTVAQGLAVARSGEVLELRCPITVSLIQPAAPTTAASSPCNWFAPCGGPGAATFVAGAGLYLLTICPASGSEGKAPVNGSAGSAPCNTQYNVQGVQFRLIPLPGFVASDLADARLRNRVAHQCLGDDSQAAFVADPFAAPMTSYGLLDSLRPKPLTDCDVPLAIMYWATGSGLQFIDLWSVRRRVTAPAGAGRWDPAAGDRRRAEAQARFMQFQTHLSDLLSSGASLSGVSATQHFAFLPPAGLIPIIGDLPAERSISLFFGGLTTTNPVFIEAARVESILHESLDYPPIDLTSGLAIRIYQVRENAQAAAAQKYILFASGQMPFHGEARFDVSHWDYSNFI
ncbi:MAG TPA: hypothetical protein VG326_21370 [Tepidisphaeraceae bacterium]|jgi:hypothetical protein|nr:hypothetical protein [Tepidisphaeraceae bacterium]